MTIELSFSTGIAVGACLASTMVDVWVGLRSTGATWRDFLVVSREDARHRRPPGLTVHPSPEPGIVGCLAAIGTLDLLSCLTLIALTVLLQPGARFVTDESSTLVLWFIAGLGAPFVSSRLIVGRQVAKLFGNLFAKPSPERDRWLDQPWRVRYRLRRDLLNRVFPTVDRRFRNFDAMLRRLDIPITNGVIDPTELRESLIRYGATLDEGLPTAAASHLQDSEKWEGMTDPERRHWACVTVNIVIENDLRAVLVGYLIPPDALATS